MWSFAHGYSFYFMEVVDEENYRKIYIILFAI
jgi:hypothetical protein